MNASSSNSPRGRLLQGDGYSLDRHDPVSIGSDRGCDIVIEGADPHHAELRWDADEEAWFIHDDPAPGRTLLNDDPIESGRLHDGDRIGVAGVWIRFADHKLEVVSDKTNGINVTVCNLTARIPDSDAQDGWKVLIRDVSFDVRAGSFCAILGPSGGGKSTLLQRIAGFPICGELRGGVFFNGKRVSPEDEQLLRHAVYLPQAVDDTLHADMTVHEEMEDFVRCHLSADAKPDFKEKLDAVDLKWGEIAKKRIGKLSGGQKRRLALALALLRNPRLLLLDEPTAGLDPASEQDVMKLLRRLSGEKGATILCATHVLGSLGECREVLLLDTSGRLAFHGSPSAAMSHFETENWVEIYRRLDNGALPWHDRPEEVSAPVKSGLPDLPLPASLGTVFRRTLLRLLGSVFSKWNPILFFGVPVVVSIILLCACGSLFKNHNEGTVYFCMAVAMFWFGVSGTFRNLVSERVPKRCLDRMSGIPLGRYLAAHAAFAAIVSGIQSLLFVLPIFIRWLGHAPYTLHALPAFWFDLALVGFAGGCVGTAVSAGAKKELYAAWLIPLVTIPVLFLSKPVLENGSREEDKPTGLIRAIECVMPTLYSQTVLETSMVRAQTYHVMPDPAYLGSMSVGEAQKRSVESWTRRPEKRDKKTGSVVKDKDGNPLKDKSWADKHVDDVFRFFALMAGYAAVFLFLAFRLQNWRERKWDGR